MALETKCQTPGAIFSTKIGNVGEGEFQVTEVSISVRLPFTLDLSENHAEILEANLHNLMEMALARYFNRFYVEG